VEYVFVQVSQHVRLQAKDVYANSNCMPQLMMKVFNAKSTANLK
jgi:hypothetical protein